MWPSKVECMTTTVSYLHEQLTLIFVREIQADKSSFLKSPHVINQPLVVCFTEVYRFINNRRGC